MSEAGNAYLDALRKMDAPTMAAAEASDPDVAFARAVIPHHQGAVAMARAVLQYGKDGRVKERAHEIITYFLTHVQEASFVETFLARCRFQTSKTASLQTDRMYRDI